MKIDLHIHSKEGSDGKLGLKDIFTIALERGVEFLSITDHDSIESQHPAQALADSHGIHYISGIELNITFSHPKYKKGKPISLDVLGYGFNPDDGNLQQKLTALRDYRKRRAERILNNVNEELEKEGHPPFTPKDMRTIEESVDGALGRPHLANYMVKRGIVSHRQEAFDKYLVRCNVPKMPLFLSDASTLIRNAGGKMILAHPNDPNGTSLISFTSDLQEQLKIIKDSMLDHLDGIECWHSRHDDKTSETLFAFAKKEGLLVTGGSDCHQQPIILGSVDIPDLVAEQFGIRIKGVKT